ncbi:MAG TPA: DUF4167 domain-containing protein [Afifellaceae bacterium]|nr:DUF4167 domain-containing protein [Afifellaceae bacterium]
MRHNQNRRSRGRSRKGPNPLTRSFESNGPDVKVRGTAAHIAEKYGALARDAQAAGDYVAAENYYQHAEHYNRIVAAAQAAIQAQQRDNADDDGDDDDRADARGGDGRESSRESGRDSGGRDNGEDRPVAAHDRGSDGEGDGEPRKRRRPRREQKSDDAEGGAQAASGSDEGDGGRPRGRPRKVNGHDAGGAEGDAAAIDSGEPAHAKSGTDEAADDGEAVTKDGSAALAAFPD